MRYRVDEGWTLKILQLDADDLRVLKRKEYHFESKPDRIPPGALDLASAYHRGAPLAPVAELRTLRTKRAIREDEAGDVVADVVDDDVYERVARGGVDPELTQRPIVRTSTGVEIFAEAFTASAERLVRSAAGSRAYQLAEASRTITANQRSRWRRAFRKAVTFPA